MIWPCPISAVKLVQLENGCELAGYLPNLGTHLGKTFKSVARSQSSRSVRSYRIGLLAGIMDGGLVQVCPGPSASVVSKSVSKSSCGAVGCWCRERVLAKTHPNTLA